ncbi:MAG TPA: universal stress protein [Bryobacteraceae bacterium]|jgi:nucleotide-binding universal stress UspA family protein
MFQLKRILFPVDFSERCRGAAAYVEALAGRFEAELILLHVIEPAAYNRTLSEEPLVGPREIMAFFGDDLKYLRTEILIQHGEAARKIVECAAGSHADLIMMPTQGLGIYRRLIIGSNTAKVLHDADCPVWTGVHLENAPPLEKVHTDRILCAVDLKRPSALVLDWANQLAKEYQAELTLLHVTSGRVTSDLITSDPGVSDEEARDALQELQKAVGSNAAIRILDGDPAKLVAETARELGADLLVIGRRAEIGLLGRLEVTAYSIIRQSPCPVVSV